MRQPTMARWGTALAVSCLGVAAPLAAGTYMEQKVTASQSGMNMEVKAWADGDSGRVEFSRSDSAIMPAGSYLLTTDGGRTVYLVKPAERTYSVWDLEALFASFSQMAQGAQGLIDMKFQDLEAEELGSEAGGELLGFDTTRKSWRTAYTMDLKVAFMQRSERMETTTEAWITQDVDNPALGMWFSVKPPTTGNPDLDAVLTQSMEQIDGLPLKIVQKSTATQKKGGSRSSSLTLEVTVLREEAVDGDLFEMPDGYDEVPLIAAAQGDQGKDNPLGGLGGLFGRKKKPDGR